MAPEIKHHFNELRVVQNFGWFRSKSRCKESNRMFQSILCLDWMMQEAIWTIFAGVA
jgi:hypothetical protein